MRKEEALKISPFQERFQRQRRICRHCRELCELPPRCTGGLAERQDRLQPSPLSKPCARPQRGAPHPLLRALAW